MSSEQQEPEPPQTNWSDDPLGWMAVWADADVPVPQMLRALADEYGGRAAPALEVMAQRVEAGDSLTEAFQATRNQFPRRLARQLEFAAQSDRLRMVLPAVAMQRAESRGQLSQALAVLTYPVLVITVLLAILLFYSFFIVPTFREMFTSFGLHLPEMTQVFLWVAGVAPWIALATAVLVLLMFLVWATPPFARVVHYLLGAVPLFGRLWTCNGHHCLARLMAAYTTGGMNAPEALRASAAGLSDRNLAYSVRAVAKECEAGASMARAMAGSVNFERSLTGMVHWGETQGSLPNAFAEAGLDYQQQFQRLLTVLRRVVPPVLVIGVGFLVFLMMGALLLPMFSLISNLSG